MEPVRQHLHQGSRYEASAYAVPFLLEVAGDAATPDRASVLGLLTSLAIGYDEAWLPDGFPVADCRERARGGEEIFRAMSPLGEEEAKFWEDTLDDEAQARLDTYIELAAYDAVRAGVPLFAGIVAAPDAPVADRRAAVYALAWFPEEASVSVPALTRAAADPEPSVAASALVALGLVGPGGDGGRRLGPRRWSWWARPCAARSQTARFRPGRRSGRWMIGSVGC